MAEVSLRDATTAKDIPPTRARRDALGELLGGRWFGRCAVLHDEAGSPTEIYFLGWSGD